MTTRHTTAFGAGLLISLLGSVVHAQQATPTQPTFDLLQSAHMADSLRRVADQQQAALAKALRANSAKSDTIVMQRRELAALAVRRARHDSAATHSALAPASLPAVAAPVATTTVPEPTSHAPVSVSTPPATAAPAPAPPVTPVVASPSPATQRPAASTSPVLTGMLQFWIVGGDAGYRNTYRVRRAELRASGTVAPKIAWTIMLDLGKALSVSTTTSGGTTKTSVAQGSRVLQDAAIMLQLHPRARLDLGQQKIPFGIEGFQSSGTLITVERALFASDRARGGSFGDMRDVGLSVRGRLAGTLDYQVGAFNGSGESQNDVDANLSKAVVAHVAYRPRQQFLVGASGVSGGRGAADAPTRDRVGTELRVQTTRWLLQSEAVAGHDGAVARQGVYVHAGYRALRPLDLHLRFDAWDPDRAREEDAASATERDYLAGLTWNVPGTPLKAQADGVRRTYSAALVPNRWQLLVNLQTSW